MSVVVDAVILNISSLLAVCRESMHTKLDHQNYSNDQYNYS